MPTILATERLQLLPFTLNDTAFIIALLNSNGWLQFIGNRNVTNTAQATHYITNGPLKSYAKNGFGLWLVRLKSTQTPIGMCGILKRPTLAMPDIGFAFLPQYQGKGYAYEIVIATLAYATNQLKIPQIKAIVTPTNIQSKKLLEKVGFKYVNTFSFPDSNEVLLQYETTPANL